MEIIDISNLRPNPLKGVLRKFPDYYEYCFINRYEEMYDNFHVHTIELEEGTYVSLLETKKKTIMVSIQLPISWDRDVICEFLDRYNFSFNSCDKNGFYVNKASEIVEGKLFKGMPIVMYIIGKKKIYYDPNNFKEITDYYNSLSKITNTGIAKEVNLEENSKKVIVFLNEKKINNFSRINFDLSMDYVICNGIFIVADYLDEYCETIGFYTESDSNLPIAYFLDYDSPIYITLEEKQDGSKICIIEQKKSHTNEKTK